MPENYSVTVNVTKTVSSYEDDKSYSVEVNRKLVSAEPKFNVDGTPSLLQCVKLE